MSLQHLYKIFCLIIQVLQVFFFCCLQIRFVILLINDDADGDNTYNITYNVIIIIIIKVRVLSLVL